MRLVLIGVVTVTPVLNITNSYDESAEIAEYHSELNCNMAEGMEAEISSGLIVIGCSSRISTLSHICSKLRILLHV